MKTRNGDEQVREKVSSLDTLSGGIVFGKEEAWDKLQARMDKPVRRIAWRYVLAAAAVLLVVVCVVPVYYGTLKNDVPATVKVEATMPVTAPASVAPEMKAVENVVHAKVAEVQHDVPPQRPQRKQKLLLVTKNNAEMPSPTAPPESKIIEPTPSVKEPAPTTLAKTAIPVLHINDVDRSAAMQTTSAVAAGSEPKIDFKRMPVMHINGVEREEMEVRTIRRENRVTFGHLLFAHPQQREVDVRGIDLNIEAQEYQQPHSIFKNIFNTQN